MKRIFSLLLLCSVANLIAWAAPSQPELRYVKANHHHVTHHHAHKAGHHKPAKHSHHAT